MTCHILACGNDKELLATRAMVLATASFEVDVVLGVEGLRSRQTRTEMKLIVLCHSLTEVEQNRAIRDLRQGLPQIPILVLSRSMRADSSSGIAVLDPFAGPRSLINLSRELTRA